MLTERVPGLALDLVGVRDHVVEPVVLADPLGGRLGAHAGNAGGVVRALSYQCRDLRITEGRDAIPLLHGVRSDPGHLGDASARVQDRARVTDELERVTVTGADQHLEAL